MGTFTKNWVSVSPSSGSASTSAQTLTISASTHTGRVERKETIHISGATTSAITVTQAAAAEFIRTNAPSYSIGAAGGTIDIVGTGNSSGIFFAVKCANSSIRLVGSEIYSGDLSVDGGVIDDFDTQVAAEVTHKGVAYKEAAGAYWGGGTGGPGTANSFDWDISFTIPENTTTAPALYTFLVASISSNAMYPSETAYYTFTVSQSASSSKTTLNKTAVDLPTDGTADTSAKVTSNVNWKVTD